MNDRQLSELWLTSLSSERGASPGTIETYRDDLNVYLRWLLEQELTLIEPDDGMVMRCHGLVLLVGGKFKSKSSLRSVRRRFGALHPRLRVSATAARSIRGGEAGCA
nr:site-specific integrase [Bosea sp. ASV33]